MKNMDNGKEGPEVGGVDGNDIEHKFVAYFCYLTKTRTETRSAMISQKQLCRLQTEFIAVYAGYWLKIK